MTGQRIRARREALEMTQAEASARCKPPMAQPSWSDYEAGHVSPSVEQLRRIAAALGCKAADLL